MKNKKLVIAADHAGFEYKANLIAYLTEKGYEMIDAGTYSAESCDYPVPVHALCKVIQSGECDKGILICGTGIGIGMAVNEIHVPRRKVKDTLFVAALDDVLHS